MPAGGDFSIGGVASVTVNTVAISGSMVTLTLSQAVTSGDTVTVSYTKPGTNPLRDAAGNESVGLTNAAVTNNTPAPTPPSPPTAVMASSDAAGALAVSWTAPSPAPAGGYHVQYRLGSGAWMPADPGQAVAMDATSHTFTGLAAGMYHARVRSVGVPASNTSAWVGTAGAAVQVDVRTVRIDSEIRVNRNGPVTLGCTEVGLDPDDDTCMMFNLEVQFRGVIDRTSGLEFVLTDAPAHGHLNEGSTGSDLDLLSVGETVPWSQAQLSSQWAYYHHDYVTVLGLGSIPTNADVDALTDSFEFSFEGTTYTVNLVINQPPVVVATPSTPGSFTVGTEATFEVADDFTDPNDDTLMYALGTVAGPVTSAVSISNDGTVTIDTTATAGDLHDTGDGVGRWGIRGHAHLHGGDEQRVQPVYQYHGAGCR